MDLGLLVLKKKKLREGGELKLSAEMWQWRGSVRTLGHWEYLMG